MNGENQLIPKPIRCVSGAHTLTFLFGYLAVSIFSANKMDWIVFFFSFLVREFFLFRLALYSHSIVPGIGKGDGEVNVQGKCFPLFFFTFSSIFFFLCRHGFWRRDSLSTSIRLYALPQKTRQVPKSAIVFSALLTVSLVSKAKKRKRETNTHLSFFTFLINNKLFFFSFLFFSIWCGRFNPAHLGWIPAWGSCH